MARRETVTQVVDGDTFMTDRRKNAVRLAGVDTPERHEPGYEEATRALAALIEGREVSIETKARDSYGRAVANVKVGGRSVNKAMKNLQQ